MQRAIRESPYDVTQNSQAFPLRSISPDSGGKCLRSRQKGGRFAASEKGDRRTAVDEVLPEASGSMWASTPTDSFQPYKNNKSHPSSGGSHGVLLMPKI